MADAKHLVYNLGVNAVERSKKIEGYTFLRPWAAAHWNALCKPQVRAKLTIRIPGSHKHAEGSANEQGK